VSGPLDLELVARMLAVAGSTAHEGEAINAIRLVDRLLRAAGMRFPDLVASFKETAVAVEAAQVLAREVEELRAELERRRGAAAVALGHADDWYPGAAAQQKAQWCLDLHATGELWLNTWEHNFLASITEWKGQLSKRQEPVFERLLQRVAERVGRSPR
jgi:hypothetical protein